MRGQSGSAWVPTAPAREARRRGDRAAGDPRGATAGGALRTLRGHHLEPNAGGGLPPQRLLHGAFSCHRAALRDDRGLRPGARHGACRSVPGRLAARVGAGLRRAGARRGARANRGRGAAPSLRGRVALSVHHEKRPSQAGEGVQLGDSRRQQRLPLSHLPVVDRLDAGCCGAGLPDRGK